MNTDRFGRIIIDNGDGSFQTDEILIESTSLELALETFNAMAPEGWIEPLAPVPPSPVAALASLIVNSGIATVEDVAAAINTSPEEIQNAISSINQSSEPIGDPDVSSL